MENDVNCSVTLAQREVELLCRLVSQAYGTWQEDLHELEAIAERRHETLPPSLGGHGDNLIKLLEKLKKALL